MSRVRIAVASTPLSASLQEAVPATVTAIAEAGRQGADIVCLPEATIPGHRHQSRPVADVTGDEIAAALDEVARAARTAAVAVIVGIERPTDAGRLISAVVIDDAGRVVGEQVKTQLDPSEERTYTVGSGRRLFTLGPLTFGIAICHEAYRYPEIVREAASAGAQVVFVPHYVTTDDGSLPTRWCDPAGPYNEKALMCRAIENTIYVAPSNNAMEDQGSASCVIAPDGTLVDQVPYGEAGVVAVDLDLDAATALIARRWAPERSRLS